MTTGIFLMIKNMFIKKNNFLNKESIDFIKKLSILSCFAVFLYILLQIKDIIFMLFFAGFLNILFSPMLNYLNKYKIGDTIGITIIYFIFILFLIVIFFTIIPIFIEQITNLRHFLIDGITQIKNIYGEKGIEGFNLPGIIKNFVVQFDINSLINSIKENISSILGFFGDNFKNFLLSGAGVIFSFTNGLFTFVLTMLFAFFMALERKNIKKFIYNILPINLSNYFSEREDIITNILFSWFKGQIMLGVAIFFITLIGLFFIKIFGINMSSIFSLALIAGMMEFIPYFGPILALLPALAIAIGLGFTEVVVILILYLVIQQLENNLLVPYIMSKSLNVSPFAIFVGMIIGASLLGIIGILIAVPLVSIIQLFINDSISKIKE